MTRPLPGLCSVTFRALPPEEVATIAAANGLRAIEWAGDAHAPPGDIAAARRCAAAAARHGIAWLSYGSYFGAGTGADPAAVLESARAMGARHLRVWAGARGTASADAAPGVAAAAAADLSSVARRAGCPVSVEYHAGTLCDGAEQARALLDAAAEPNLFSLWQPLHGLSQADAALAEIALLGDVLSHLHVFHWTSAKQRLPLDLGAGLWRNVLRTLPRSRLPEPRVAFLEFTRDDDPDCLAEDAAVLRSWLADGGHGLPTGSS
jgi:sugar phosphate isomerase/epimerase